LPRSPIPYPPSPKRVPPDLTDPGRDSAARVIAVLGGLFLFLVVYVGFIVVTLALIVALLLWFRHLPFPVLWVLAALVGSGFSLILIKGLFARPTREKGMEVEITPDDQPVFFAFLRRLTDEIGAPMPHRVFVSPDVNAAVMPEHSLANLFVQPKKNLLVGLGLLNMLNLSEFKAVMGHEFGHFSQKTLRLHAYAYVANRVMFGILNGPDRLDLWIASARRHARHSQDFDGLAAGIVAATIGGSVWLVRAVMGGLYRLVNFAAMALSRENEFHADRIGVSVAGSNAMVHSLYRIGFAETALEEAGRQLEVASQHRLYTRDLFFHQTTAADYLRKKEKKPHLGLPPALEGPHDGEDIRLFDPDEDSPVPEMWASHPMNFDREENAKEIFIAAKIDERSPWLLLTDADELKERVTYKFYRVAFKVKKDADLVAPEQVQGFLDDEHAEVSYDAKYHGAYDERWIDPGRVEDLNQLLIDEPWEAERIERVHSRLYRELGHRVEDLADVRKAIQKLYRRCFGRPRGLDRSRLEDLEEEFEELSDWFASFDRRVYMVFGHMAKQVDEARLKELTHRYQFHLEVQSIHRQLLVALERVLDVIAGLEHYGEELPEDFFHELMDTFRDGREAMQRTLDRASGMVTPAMANIKKGSRFDRLIFDKQLLTELPRTFVKGKWVNKLVDQMTHMRHRVHRMDFKSLGAILQMQDRLAAEWLAKVARPSAGEELLELEVLEDAPADRGSQALPTTQSPGKPAA
jgi:Zn-dependent protease with chaperone function